VRARLFFQTSPFAGVRHGLADGISREQAQKDIETIAHEVLANPVIEEYRVELVD